MCHWENLNRLSRGSLLQWISVSFHRPRGRWLFTRFPGFQARKRARSTEHDGHQRWRRGRSRCYREKQRPAHVSSPTLHPEHDRATLKKSQNCNGVGKQRTIHCILWMEMGILAKSGVLTLHHVFIVFKLLSAQIAPLRF